MKLADWDVTVCWPGGRQYWPVGQPRLVSSSGVGTAGAELRSKRGVPRPVAINHSRSPTDEHSEVAEQRWPAKREALSRTSGGPTRPGPRPILGCSSSPSGARIQLATAVARLPLTRRRRIRRRNGTYVMSLSGTFWHLASTSVTSRQVFIITEKYLKLKLTRTSNPTCSTDGSCR